jgi:hypothetical protein
MARVYTKFMSTAGSEEMLASQPPEAQPFTVEFRNYTSGRFRSSRLQLCGDDMPAVVSLLERRLVTL